MHTHAMCKLCVTCEIFQFRYNLKQLYCPDECLKGSHGHAACCFMTQITPFVVDAFNAIRSFQQCQLGIDAALC